MTYEIVLCDYFETNLLSMKFLQDWSFHTCNSMLIVFETH